VNVLRSRRQRWGAGLGLDSQALAALGATRVQDSAATAGSHADTETVGALAADDGRLVSTFHFLVSLICKNGWDQMGEIIFYAAHSCLVATHKTRQAVNPQLNLNFCLSVNNLGKYPKGKAQRRLFFPFLHALLSSVFWQG